MQRATPMRWGWGPSAPAVAVVCAWMAASSSLILLNKAIYNDGFHFPLMATAIGRFFSASGGAALLALGCAPPCRPPTNRRLLSITPIVVLTVATLYAGNLAAITLSVSFMQIMKGLTPGVTLLVAAARGLEHLSMPLAVVVLLTAAGTGVGVLVEGCAPGFDRFAFGAMAASCAIEALRSVLVQELHAAQGGAFHPAEALVYIGMPAAVCLFALSLVFERPAVLTLGTGLVAAKPLLYLASFAAAFATNITGFWAIQVTSSLTLKICGCGKNVAVVAIGKVQLGDAVTPLQALGYLVSLAGFFFYSSLRAQVPPKLKRL